jgi:hypothetical protein
LVCGAQNGNLRAQFRTPVKSSHRQNPAVSKITQ